MSTARSERVWRGYGGRVLLTLTFGYAAMLTGRMMLSPLLPRIIAELDITPFRAGAVLSVLLWCNALMQFPSGRLADELSRQTVVAAAFLVAVVGFAVLANATTYALFLLGGAAVGVATGLYPAAALAWIADLFDDRRGRAFGINTAAIDTGSALSAGLATVVLAVATWRSAFLPIAGVVVVCLLGLHRVGRESYVLKPVPLRARRTMGSLVGTRRMQLVLACYSLFMFSWQAVAGFLPTYLQAAKGFGTLFASGGFATLFVVGIAVKPLVGSLGDRYTHEGAAIAVLALGCVGLAGLLVFGSTALVLASVVVFAVGLMGFSPPMLMVLTAEFEDDTLGAELGGARTVYMTAGAFGPAFVGFVAGRLSYVAAFAGVLCCLVASVGLLGLVALESRAE